MKQHTPAHYFDKYLPISPLSHAIWRACEASALSKYPFKHPVLDIGCGFGEFAGIFFNSKVQMGVDINEQETVKAIARGKYKQVLTADARKLPIKNNAFNTVISISVLEHISTRARVFKEVFRVLRPGGLFIYTVPTRNLYRSLLGVKILRALGLSQLAKNYYELLNKIFIHRSLPSPNEWAELATNVGFVIKESEGTVSSQGIMAWEVCLPLALPSQLLKWWVGRRIVLGGKLREFIFSGMKRFASTDSDCMANILVVAQKP